MTIVKSTVMRTEVDGSQIDCRADRNIDHQGKARLGVQLHVLKGGGANMGGASGTLMANSFEEMSTLISQLGRALEQLRQADGT